MTWLSLVGKKLFSDVTVHRLQSLAFLFAVPPEKRITPPSSAESRHWKILYENAITLI
jgi:hypothetical protein